MAKKLQLVSELADRTAREVSHDADSWKRYLDTASRLYKYSFKDQLLIYAQRPDASACADMEVWNEKLHRWVRAGSKGIALIHEGENGRPRLDYVFDVADTRPVQGARMPYLWEMREEHHPAVLAMLKDRYGEGSMQDIGSRLMETAADAAQKVCQEYLRDLNWHMRKGSILEGMTGWGWKTSFREALIPSVQYAVLKRCGLEPSDYLAEDGLFAVRFFSTPAVLYHLGNAVSSLSMEILQEIGRVIRSYDLEKKQEPQKKTEKTLENISDPVYTKDIKQFSDLKRESIEGGTVYGRADIHEERGLPDSGSDAGRGGQSGRNAVREIRDAEAELSPGAPPRDLHIHAADGAADAASVSDRPAGAGTGGPDRGGYDEGERRGRGPERPRSDGMAAGREQLHSAGGGGSAAGDRVPVSRDSPAVQELKNDSDQNKKQETAGAAPVVSAPEKTKFADAAEGAGQTREEPQEAAFFQLSLFPTLEEQAERMARAGAAAQQGEKGASADGLFVNPAQLPDSIINHALTSGGNETGSILRVIAFFQKSPSITDAAAFLKKEYGTGGKGIVIAGEKYALWFHSDGIRMARGISAEVPGSTFVTWEKAAASIAQLLKDGTYAVQEKLDAALENEYAELAADLVQIYWDTSEEARKQGVLPHISKLCTGSFPDSTDHILKALHDPDQRKIFCREMEGFHAACKADPALQRFRQKNPEDLARRLSALDLPREQYPAAAGFVAAGGSFITEDELAHFLMRGSGVSESKMRIYAYFMQGHDAGECTAFLKNEYGTGGYACSSWQEWHDAKGITFTRSDDLSGSQGYDTVKMNWSQVQKRIRGLVDAGKYLNEKERAYMPDYEKLQLARSIYAFYQYASHPADSGLQEWDIQAAERDIRPLLDSPKRSAELYADMMEKFVLVQPEDSRSYRMMQKAVERMAAYECGEYSLFTPLAKETLHRQRMEREAAKKAEKDGRTASSRGKEKEPAGELEAAARAPVRKQEGREKEQPDGQLVLDFTAKDAADPEKSETNRKETAEGEKKAEKAETGNDPADRETDKNAPLSERGLRPEIKTDTAVEKYTEETVEAEFSVNKSMEAELHANKSIHTEGHADKIVTAELQVKSVAAVYRETLALLTDTMRKSGFADYLRDREPDAGSVAAELDGELEYFIAELEDTQPELFHAFHGLPFFRQWMVEDLLERTYQDTSNGRDALTRHAEDADLPEWAREELPAQEKAGVQESRASFTAPSQNEPELSAGHMELAEAQILIADFCYEQYRVEDMDFSSLEHIGLAFTSAEDEKYEITAEANLLDFSISQLVNDVSVQKRKYGSLRELIDQELSCLDFDKLVRLEAEPEALLESRLAEESTETSEPKTDRQESGRQEFVLSGGMQPESAAVLSSGTQPGPDAALSFGTQLEPTAMLSSGTQPEPNVALSAGIQLEPAAVPPSGMQPEANTAPPAGMPEIEGGQIQTADSAEKNGREKTFYTAVQKPGADAARSNYRITDDALGTGGQKTKYQNNITAIRTLKQLEAENRPAAPKEQEVLAKYVGWGGLAQAFDPQNKKWEKEYAQLKELLTSAEYESARGSVLNAHFTSPAVIRAMYDAVSAMDFTPVNILEPSCGIGNFFGLLPEKFGDADLHGVELDSITGRIAGQLYQKAAIIIGGFEDTEYPDNFFDLAVGNVPFGQYQVHDKRYEKQNLNIHDYFLVKALDQVRPGGILAFITTKGTMDKADSRAREALARKADLLGAVRLPNNAFAANAGTSVTCDILFFQKRGSVPVKLPDWVQTGKMENGVPLNQYFLQHPQMVLGKMDFWKNMYSNETETACLPIPGADLSVQLSEAVKKIQAPDRALLHPVASGQEKTEPDSLLPADPDVRNFSFTEKDGGIYFRENSHMVRIEPGKMQAARIHGMICIRDSARELIRLQQGGAGDDVIQTEQARLNAMYDDFQKNYGLLNSAANRMAFHLDASYPLLCSLEVLDEEGNFKRKADMFTKRTICHRTPVTSVDTAVEALGVSIGERACVDLEFMASLMGGREKIPQIVSDLKGVIFKDPSSGPFDSSLEGTDWKTGWQAADEYLSGNVRRKLETARAAAEAYPEFAANVEALEKVQPKDLSASEISVRIGAPWVDVTYYRQFLFELLRTPEKLRDGKISVLYSDVTGEWRVKGKQEDSVHNARVWNAYGTKRINAYEIFEASLNQRSVQVFDTQQKDGREVRILNMKETAIAQQKQEALKEAFQNWIFQEPQRRADLCAVYNRQFNAVRPRAYDGQHIHFGGMNPEIRLEPHQRNAVARILYGGNSLIAHVVGAGKTYTLAAAAMESKRLGLCRKPMFVVPNHLTEQWGSDFLTLYPGANVLVATKKDFEPKNRKKFCARITSGDYDAVVIGYTQFEKIPISRARQRAVIHEQADEITDAILAAKAEREEPFTIKQMEKTKKRLETKMKKFYDKKKDDTVYFEELGVDRLFVDEAHNYKNLYMHTKMRNVAGISQTDAQKSSDMFAKCRYMDEITGGRGIVFATGTPVSNSIVELYTMMRYLQCGMLEQGWKDSAGNMHSLKHFDNWASTFGEQVAAVELKPEGTGFRLKTRFSRFYNLPELMNLWKEAADIQTADMLKLPVPEAEYITIQTEPSAAQKQMVQALAVRAEKIRNEKLDPRIDNMLKVTADGRKLALDQRILNPLLPDDPGSKVNACVENVFRIWQESTPQKGTQLIFSDLSTPKGRREPEGALPADGTETGEETFLQTSVYEDIRNKLVKKGIPAQQIAFIHDADTEAQKAELFAKVRSGRVRVLLGSTQKMGAGTNAQTKLVASHDLDCPWRPADLEQRAGRIVRRGNENDHVKIFRYVTKGTFDAYTWGLVEAKQKFIGQIMTSKSPVRSMEDVDAAALSYAEVKMLATGDARIKEKMDLDIQVAKLKMLKASHLSLQYEMQDRVRGYFPKKIRETQLLIDCLKADLALLETHPAKENDFSMTILETAYTERKEAGRAVVSACLLLVDLEKEITLGEYRGFPMKLGFSRGRYQATMKQHLTYTAELSDDASGNIARINNALEKIPQQLKKQQEKLAQLEKELESAQEEAERPFALEAELAEKSARLAVLNTALDETEKGKRQEPPQDSMPLPDGGKPSILQGLKEYQPPAPAREKKERGRESREAV